ncbi:MAG TPA: MurR/RpiR family transcriptional regulator [Burkholderiaceae bacterium]|jgi:DNA-binding MurR/RpiR family transcriptional regulator|nr:MurR/RpiR family transcriptional regulator [Burkholderiaceae bacterium]
MPQATDFEQLQATIAAAYPRLSPQQQQLGRFALERPDEMALGTVAAVAEAAGVQPSALIRFANALGFGGFSELQQPLRARLLHRSASYRERIDALHREAAPRAVAQGEAGVLQRFVAEAGAELAQLEDHVPRATLAAGAALLAGAARVHVLAQRRAFPVAAYLAYALGQLEIPTQLLDGMGGMLADTLRRIGKRELLLVASFRPYSPEVVAAAADAQQRGVPVVAITDTALSPLKPPARVCFELGHQANPAFQSLVAPMCLAQVLVVCTGQRLAEIDSKKRPRKGESK